MISSKNLIFIISLYTILIVSICGIGQKFEFLDERESLNVCGDNSLLENIITVREGGKFGNCFWEYSSVMALGSYLNFCPYMPQNILNCLKVVFHGLSIPSYEEAIISGHCSHYEKDDLMNVTWPSWEYVCHSLLNSQSINDSLAYSSLRNLKKMKDSGQLPNILILQKYIAHSEAVLHYGVHKIRKEFKFKIDVIELVQKTLNSLIELVERATIFVGVHVRRKDYIPYLKQRYGSEVAIAGSGYYKRAMKRMRGLFPDRKLVFVVISDDRKWCMENLVNDNEGIYWGGMEGSHFMEEQKLSAELAKAHDFALLASINHSIITYGTFGVSGALLSGGHTIVFNASKYDNISDILSINMAKRLSNWNAIE